MNRRSFLKSTLAIAAALGLPRLAQQHTPPQTTTTTEALRIMRDRTQRTLPQADIVTSGWVTTSHIACSVLTSAKLADNTIVTAAGRNVGAVTITLAASGK